MYLWNASIASSDSSWRLCSMLKVWISPCHTPCSCIVPHLIGPTSYFCRSGGAIASAMKPGSMDAAAAPKERTEVRQITKILYCSPPRRVSDRQMSSSRRFTRICLRVTSSARIGNVRRRLRRKRLREIRRTIRPCSAEARRSANKAFSNVQRRFSRNS